VTSRIISAAAVIVAFGTVFLFAGRESPGPRQEQNEAIEVFTMAQAADPALATTTGFSYSPGLAARFGLGEAGATALQSPLLGVALEIKTGLRGLKVCVLHVLYDASIDIRLPDLPEMHAIGSNVDVFPNGFLQRPDAEVRKFMAAQVGALSHRAIFRNGRAPLTASVVAGEDPDGSFTSMPLNAYKREFLPGVGWLAMSVNCELAAHEDYTHASLFVETNASPADMIANGLVDPARMIEFRIPSSLLEGMRPALRAATEPGQGGNGAAAHEKFRVIK
jgi:hypothetical protein